MIHLHVIILQILAKFSVNDEGNLHSSTDSTDSNDSANKNIHKSIKSSPTGYTKMVVFFVQTVPIVSMFSEHIREFFAFFNFNYFENSCSFKLDYYQFFLFDIMVPAVSF